MTTHAQSSQILAHLEYGSITPMEALKKYHCFRLAARINDLRKQGHRIVTENIMRNGKRFARYTLL